MRSKVEEVDEAVIVVEKLFKLECFTFGKHNTIIPYEVHDYQQKKTLTMRARVNGRKLALTDHRGALRYHYKFDVFDSLMRYTVILN